MHDNTNKISIWRKREDAKPNAPDFKIDLNVDGADFSIALWKRRESDNPNGPALRGSIERKDADVHQPKQNAYAAKDDFADEMPF